MHRRVASGLRRPFRAQIVKISSRVLGAYISGQHASRKFRKAVSWSLPMGIRSQRCGIGHFESGKNGNLFLESVQGNCAGAAVTTSVAVERDESALQPSFGPVPVPRALRRSVDLQTQGKGSALRRD